MVIINIKNIDGQTKIPLTGTPLAAGYDIIATSDPKFIGDSLDPKFGENEWMWNAIDYVEYSTTLSISPQSQGNVNYHSLILPRSSIRKYNLVLANSVGLIDSDYRGEISFCFKYLWQPNDLAWVTVKDSTNPDKEYPPLMLGRVNYNKIYKKGDKIGQLIADETNPIDFRLVQNLDDTQRGTGGYGSTDKPISNNPVVIPHLGNDPIHPQLAKNLGIPHQEIPANPKGSGESLLETYTKLGGVNVKKRYIDEFKQKQR